MRLKKCILSFIGATTLGACVHKGPNPVDPYESFNRKVHHFNTVFDRVIAKPPAKLYKAITPNCVRKGINNFYNNLDMIPTVINDLLQAEGNCAILDTWRFFINSTIGVAGFFDVAEKMHLPFHSNDLGLTLAKWGDKESPYLVLPLLGPNTIRDASGLVFQFALYSPYVYLRNNPLMYSLLGLRYIDIRAQFLDTEHFMDQALDEYSFIRDAYLQHRAYLINGSTEEDGSLYIEDGGEEGSDLGNDYIDE